MGSGRDKRKKAAAAKGKPRGPSGADKAADRASRKAEKRAEAAAAAGDGDLDALLAAFKLEDERREAVVVQEGVPPPGARVFASWTTVRAGVAAPHPGAEGSVGDGSGMHADHSAAWARAATPKPSPCPPPDPSGPARKGRPRPAVWRRTLRGQGPGGAHGHV